MKKPETPKGKRERTPNNRTATGFRISDELWAVLQPLLPEPVKTHRFGGGRPRVPDRDCANAIFYVLKTGCRWQALDQTELCPHSTAHDRFQEWVKAGVFLKLWPAGLERFDELQGMDWDRYANATKAPLEGKKIGRNRRKSGRKHRMQTSGHQVPIGLAVEETKRQEMKLEGPTREGIVIELVSPTK